MRYIVSAMILFFEDAVLYSPPEVNVRLGIKDQLNSPE